MKGGRLYLLPVIFAGALCACENPVDKPPTPPTPPEPEEVYITVTTRDGAEVTSYDLSFASFSESLVVKSNGKWETFVAEDVDWLSVSATSAATAVLYVSPNTGRESRAGKIAFTSADGSVTVEIPVTQGFGYSIGASPVRDLLLVYDGDVGNSRVYDRKRFNTFIVSDDETPQWLFDGFVFVCSKYLGRSFAGGHNLPPSVKQDWNDILDYYLEDGHSIPALEAAIEDVKGKAPGEFHRRKVVIFMPDPQTGQTNWGEIDGRALDFTEFADRIVACKWYVDQMLDKFSQKDFENIQLAGIYWLVENGGFLPKYLSQVADHIHSKNLEFYWIPYYKAFGHADWEKYGFDHAYYQPNYLFTPTIPKQRLYDACNEAAAEGMSLEVEFDTHFPLQRNTDYVDVYEELGVFDTHNLAYYGETSFESWSTGISSEYALYKRVSNIIAERQKRFYNYQY